MPATDLIEQCSRRRLASYGKAAVVQKAMAQALIAQLPIARQTPVFGNVLELDHGSGFLTQAVLE